MKFGGWLFLVISWVSILSLMATSFVIVLRKK